MMSIFKAIFIAAAGTGVVLQGCGNCGGCRSGANGKGGDAKIKKSDAQDLERK